MYFERKILESDQHKTNDNIITIDSPNNNIYISQNPKGNVLFL